MAKQPKTVTLTHPNRGRTRRVPVDQVDMFRSQGWREPEPATPRDQSNPESTSEA